MNALEKPRVSILIPNYNNGRESSLDGRTDLIRELLDSLHRTLRDEPTPFEILVYDDGSTDDSLATLRAFAGRTWPNGQPFLELIEEKHRGVLSIGANVLSRRAKGQILARLDGDVTCLTHHWVSKLAAIFDSAGRDSLTPANLGVVGPKQIAPAGHLIAFGDWVLHPCGYRHVARGCRPELVNHRLRVDHVMGCFYCCLKKVFDDIGGYDENILRGQTVDFGLRARLAGYECLAVPEIEYIHAHHKRTERRTRADTSEGIDYSFDVFTNKWGFHRVAPDLQVVSERYGKTPLTWNRQWFMPDGSLRRTADKPLDVKQTVWLRYAQDQAYAKMVTFRLNVLLTVLDQVPAPDRIGLLGAYEGLMPHLIASRGLPCTAMDWREDHVAFARQCLARQNYPSEQAKPQVLRMTSRDALPLEDGDLALLAIFDELERHANPVGLLAQAARVVRPGGHLVIVSKQVAAPTTDPSDPLLARQREDEHRYHWLELLGQIQASGHWQILIDPEGGKNQEHMVVVAQRKSPVGTAAIRAA